MSPIVSVCVPVFNGADFIGECIKSILNQSFQDFEILVLDNASTDETIKICLSFCDARIRIIRSERNIGSILNFKRCFNEASCDLVMILPHDDVMETECLGLLATPLILDSRIGLSFGRTQSINSDGAVLSTPKILVSGLLNFNQVFMHVLNNFNPIQHPLIRKSIYFGCGGFNKIYGCFLDIVMWVQIARYSNLIYISAEITTSLRSHSNQGQKILSNINNKNLTKVSSHLGAHSIWQHQLRNGYNFSYIKCLLYFESLNFSTIPHDRCFEKLHKSLVYSNIYKLLIALFRLNYIQVKVELMVFFKILKEFGTINMLRYYFLSLSDFFILMCKKSIFQFKYKIR